MARTKKVGNGDSGKRTAKKKKDPRPLVRRLEWLWTDFQKRKGRTEYAAAQITLALCAAMENESVDGCADKILNLAVGQQSISKFIKEHGDTFANTSLHAVRDNAGAMRAADLSKAVRWAAEVVLDYIKENGSAPSPSELRDTMINGLDIIAIRRQLNAERRVEWEMANSNALASWKQDMNERAQEAGYPTAALVDAKDSIIDAANQIDDALPGGVQEVKRLYAEANDIKGEINKLVRAAIKAGVEMPPKPEEMEKPEMYPEVNPWDTSRKKDKTFKMGWNELRNAISTWHGRVATEGRLVPGEIVYEWPESGYTVHKLTTKDQMVGEGAAMRHCIGWDSQGYINDVVAGTGHALSVRDRFGHPHLTLFFSATRDDFRGPHNIRPATSAVGPGVAVAADKTHECALSWDMLDWLFGTNADGELNLTPSLRAMYSACRKEYGKGRPGTVGIKKGRAKKGAKPPSVGGRAKKNPRSSASIISKYLRGQ